MLHKFFKGTSRVTILLCFAICFTWTICSCLFVEMNTKLVTNIIQQNDNAAKSVVWYILLIGFWCVVEYALDITSDALFGNVDSVTFKQGFDNIFNTKPEVLKSVNAGYVTGLIRTLQSKRSDLMNFLVMEFAMAIVYVSYFTIRLISFHWIFSVILVTVVAAGTTVRIVGKKLVIAYTNRFVEADSVVTKTFIDIATNINTVQKMQVHGFMRQKLDKSLDEYCSTMIKNTEANDVFYCVFKFIVYMYAPICLLITSNFEFGFNKVEFYALISPLSVQLVHMAKCIAAFFKRLDLYTSAQEKLDKIVNEDTLNKSNLLSCFMTIDIKDADYTYQHNVTKNTVRIQIPHIRVAHGDKICIYGESGQGKTTTLNILSRQLETDNVYIDGEQMSSRINCVFISQDTEIFDMSVRDNLTLGNTQISDDELINMLDAVGLGDWLSAQSDGLNTLLGERGVFVSTGQRQRLNLIRGLLIQDKDLYLLDEPTSNVDEFTEQRMVELIDRKLEDKTFVIVSHRKAIASICNKFYKFEDGICGPEETTFRA